jgi:hypothetical protein
MPNQLYNPIQSVDGVAVPCPSKYDWKLSDVSDGDAGRTEDGLMHKMEVTQKVHIELEWQNIGDSAAAAILRAFNPEYINVNYYDYKSMGFQTKRFYVGDRSVTTYSRLLGISTVAFNIIEQ